MKKQPAAKRLGRLGKSKIIMSKLDEKIENYHATLKGMGGKSAIDSDQLAAIAKSLGPSIYNADSSLVSCSDPVELQRVKNNFLIKRLGMTDEAEMDAAIQAVCSEYDSRQKQRVVFYYLLAQKLGKKI
ncbi:MAG: DUF2853 family protein [Bacteroidota bacterium]